MWKRIAFLALIFIVALLALAFDSFRRAGEFETLTPHPLDCGVIGPEDITIDHGRAVAYVSATDARAFTRGQPAVGGIYRYSLGDPKATPLYTPAGGRFHPHGIGFFSDGHGPDLLYVVDHATSAAPEA